jgi:hypothetical protein
MMNSESNILNDENENGKVSGARCQEIRSQVAGPRSQEILVDFVFPET